MEVFAAYSHLLADHESSRRLNPNAPPTTFEDFGGYRDLVYVILLASLLLGQSACLGNRIVLRQTCDF